MASAMTMQRDLVVKLKKETFANLRILAKLHPMAGDLTRQVFKDNALEKPTQNVFNHLSHYLVSIIDPKASNNLAWPLYDTKTERTYRSDLAAFIADYGEKSLLTPVMSSYLVNPGCYKVTMLIFQLSQLAVQRVLESKMKKESQRKIYQDITNKYKPNASDDTVKYEEIQEAMDKEIEIIVNKRSIYLRKRRAYCEIGRMFRDKILEMEKLLSETNAQGYIDDLIDGYIKIAKPDEDTKKEILKVKNVKVEADIFQKFLLQFDKQFDDIESTWERKTKPFINICKETLQNTETLIARHTGADQNSYVIEYNHKSDSIDTTELQKYVNTEQQYILKNIVKERKLNFPYLIRGFLISVSFILRNTQIGDDVYQFNEYLDQGQARYGEIVTALRVLLERVVNAESRLKTTELNVTNLSISMRDYPEIPPLPDLTDLKMNRGFHHPALLQMNRNKHHFNLRKKRSETFGKPLSKSFLITPIHCGTKEDFKYSIPIRVTDYDHMSLCHHNNNNNNQNDRANETMAQCTGFTKQQLNRLLSTRKSSAKKFKRSVFRSNVKIKKGNLFNETTMSTLNVSVCLTRSHSSPNLWESREKMPRRRSRKLSIMKEDSVGKESSLPTLEVSGITALERDSNHSTPKEICSLESSRKNSNSLPTINCDSSKTSLNEDINKDFKSPIEIPKPKTVEVEEPKPKTPATNARPIQKTGSLEKIINRFKKIRASVLPDTSMVLKNYKTIDEEKENVNMANQIKNVDIFRTNRNLLPDLLSPSCSTITQKSVDLENWFDSDDELVRKPRESLGAALGVDHTFLDEFDLDD